MIRQIWMSLSLSALFVLTGCWDRAELPEKGFVMGIALDQAKGGKISLTTQVFKPTQGVGSIGGKSPTVSFANVTTIDSTLPRAIRDIPINLGRKTQWSHTRLIIIGEQLAREQEIFSLLEFFFRDHEPRLTVSIMIAEGRADNYLNKKPYIENTISQQLFQSEKGGDRLGLQDRHAQPSAVLGEVWRIEAPPPTPATARHPGRHPRRCSRR